MDDYFAGEDKPGDFHFLTQLLEDWALWGGVDSFEFFQIWEMSGHITLPFAGSWVDQPTWLRNDFLTLLRVKRWWDINKELPSTEGLPNAENVA